MALPLREPLVGEPVSDAPAESVRVLCPVELVNPASEDAET